MRALRTLIALAATTMLALTPAGCGDDTPSTGTDPGATPPAGGSIDGEWQLTAATVDGQDLDVSAGPVTLIVEGDRWGGTSACNQYFAQATLDGSEVTVGPVGSTEMACAEPRMTLEQHYLTALQRVTSAAADDQALTLRGDGVQMAFEPLPPMEPADLVGTTWTLTTLVDGDAASSVVPEPARLLLGDDGTLTGTTGCRSFRGPWEQYGDTAMVGPLATTKIACSDETAAQDLQVLKVLDGRVTMTVDGTSLTVENGDLGLVYTTGQPAGR
jgi:heat shock protein HslJ